MSCWWTLLVVAAVLGCAQGKGGVIELTPDTFTSVVDGSTPVFVEFYAPWCPHCKHLQPEFDRLAHMEESNEGVRFAKVDADQYVDLADQYDVDGYPTVKLLPSNEPQQAVEYTDNRDADSMKAYLDGLVTGEKAQEKKKGEEKSEEEEEEEEEEKEEEQQEEPDVFVHKVAYRHPSSEWHHQQHLLPHAKCRSEERQRYLQDHDNVDSL